MLPGAGPVRSRRVAASKAPKGEVLKFNWFDSVKYVRRSGRVSLSFGYTCSMHLQGLLDEFTKVDLLAVSGLSNFYVIRLYELFSRFRSTGVFRCSLVDLRFALDCVSKYRETMKFNSRVLRPALADVNVHTDLVVEDRAIHRQRAIVGYEFRFKPKPARATFTPAAAAALESV